MSIYTALYLIAACFLIETISAAKLSAKGKLRFSYFEQIFEDRDGVMTAGETLQKLQQMQELTSERDEGWQKVLSDYIDLSKNQDKKCNWRNIKLFRLLYQTQDSHSLQIYKNHFWKERILACREKWKRELEFNVKSLTDDERFGSNEIKKSCFASISEKSFKNHFALTDAGVFSKGVFNYFEESTNYKPEELLKSKKGKVLFDKEYQVFVSNLCENVIKKLKKSIEVYHIFAHDVTNYIDDDKFTTEWLENIEVCQLLVSRNDFFSRDVYEWLKYKYPQQTVTEKFLDRLKGQKKQGHKT